MRVYRCRKKRREDKTSTARKGENIERDLKKKRKRNRSLKLQKRLLKEKKQKPREKLLRLQKIGDG